VVSSTVDRRRNRIYSGSPSYSYLPLFLFFFLSRATSPSSLSLITSLLVAFVPSCPSLSTAGSSRYSIPVARWFGNAISLRQMRLSAILPNENRVVSLHRHWKLKRVMPQHAHISKGSVSYGLSIMKCIFFELINLIFCFGVSISCCDSLFFNYKKT